MSEMTNGEAITTLREAVARDPSCAIEFFEKVFLPRCSGDFSKAIDAIATSGNNPQSQGAQPCLTTRLMNAEKAIPRIGTVIATAAVRQNVDLTLC